MNSQRIAVLALVFVAGCRAPTPASPPTSAVCSAEGTACGDDNCDVTVDRCVAGQCVASPRPASMRCSNRWVPSDPAGGYHAVAAYDVARGRVVALSAGETWEWSGARWAYRPAAVVSGVMAYDEARQRTVVVGGALGGPATTWEWDGARWQEFHPAQTPPARTDASLAYDSVRRRIVLFGGDVTTNFQHALGDTWEWDGATWVQRFPAHAPSARSQHALAFDAARGTVVLFGGWDATSHLGSDTWTWDGTDWQQLSPPTSPPGRVGHAMAWDSDRRRLVMLGGYVGNLPRDETWEFDGVTWALRVTQGAPPGRLGHAMAYDKATQKIVLFGGESLSDTWEYDGTSWVERTPTRTPTEAGALAYDSQRRRYVLVGHAHTWEWNGTSHWVQAFSSELPQGAATFDAARGVVVLVGARTGAANIETWEWDGTAWTLASVGKGPPARFGHSLGYDPVRHRVVLFGGFITRLTISRCGPNTPSLEINDTWEWDGATWLQVPTGATGPGPRGAAAFAYDEARDRFLLTGGETTPADAGFATTVADDAWGYNGIAWTQNLGSTPSARSDSTMAYDPSRGVAVLLGGQSANGAVLDDTWEWNGSTWTQRALAASPRSGSPLVFDANRRQVAAFDGLRMWWLND